MALLRCFYGALVKVIMALLLEMNCKLTVVINGIVDREVNICVEAAGALRTWRHESIHSFSLNSFLFPFLGNVFVWNLVHSEGACCLKLKKTKHFRGNKRRCPDSRIDTQSSIFFLFQFLSVQGPVCILVTHTGKQNTRHHTEHVCKGRKVLTKDQQHTERLARAQTDCCFQFFWAWPS